MEPNQSCLKLRSVAFVLLLIALIGIVSCEGKKSEISASKTNSPPSIISVTVVPEKPTIENELSLSIQSKDSKGDPISYRYQWIKNEEEIIGENQSVLKRGNFRKGDLIRVRVTPSDGKLTGAPFLSSAVKIHNTPPAVQEVWIEPNVACVTDNLKAKVKGSDPEGDFVYYNYQWEKNGSVLLDEGKETLAKGRFKKGDSIVVIVTPDDRDALGTPKRSQPLLISNSPPQIISSPPTSVEKTTYIYQIKTIDPDNDPITFALKSAPPGMVIDKKTGEIRWEIRKEYKGSHSVEIEVSDSEGARSKQRYTLTIDFK